MKNKKWKSFSLGEIFPIIQRGKRLIKNDQISGTIPYVSSTMAGNGVDGFIGNITEVRFFQNCLTIANSGSVGSVFYHDYQFIASDHVTALINPKFSRSQYLFIGVCLKMIKNKYSFNREISDRRIKNEKIILPIKNDETPDWDFMEKYIITIFNKIKQPYEFPKKHEIYDNRELKELVWSEFTINSLGTITGGKDWEGYNRISGESPFIGSSSVNNGITDFVDFSGRERQVGENVIGINRNGSVGYAFYHPYKAYFSGDTRFLKLYDYHENRFINQFIATMIMKQKDKYAFGYKMGTSRIKRQIVKLPIKNGAPDFDFMEQYMKRIENRVISKLRKLL